jgi:hypothetical protein
MSLSFDRKANRPRISHRGAGPKSPETAKLFCSWPWSMRNVPEPSSRHQRRVAAQDAAA